MDFTKPTAYQAPSWSWAAINGGRVAMCSTTIEHQKPIKNIATPFIISLEPLGEDLYGQLKSGFLIIKGSLFPMGDLGAEYWKTVSPSWEEHKSLPKRKANSDTYKYPSHHAFALQLLNKGANETFEFEQQHILHLDQTLAAILNRRVINRRKGRRKGIHERDCESSPFRINWLERRISTDGVFTLITPVELFLVVSETYRTEIRKWIEFGE